MRIYLILLLGLMTGCTQAHQQNEITNKDFEQASEAALYAQFNQLYYTKYIFKAAYKEATQISETNDQLFNFATFQMHSIQTGYDSLGINFEDDLKAISLGKKSKMTIDALDSLCVSNKFIEKYSQLKLQKNSNISDDQKELVKNSLSEQQKIKDIMKNIDNPLNDLMCKNL